MSARYLRIKPLQEPYDAGVDEKTRAKFQFNLTARKDPSTGTTHFADELVKVLVTAGVAVMAGPTRNVSTGTVAQIPDVIPDGGWLTVIETPGSAPEMRHNQIAPTYLNPTALIVARATTSNAARTLARAAYNALSVIRNQTITV